MKKLILIISALLAFSTQVFAVSGTVFRELPLGIPGQLDANEIGVPNILVSAYSGTTLLATSTTDNAGGWSIPAVLTGGGAPVRYEFTNIPSYLEPSDFGSGVPGNGTTVRFVAVANDVLTNVNVGLHNPAQFCQANPRAVTPVFVNGDPLLAPSGAPTESLYSYDYAGANKSTVAVKSETGPTWGVAYDSKRDVLYTSAVLRRHVGIGPNGGGAIYSISDPAGAPGAATLLHDVATATGVPTTAARGLTGATPTTLNNDAPAFPLIAKVGLGDIDISNDNDTLYVTNLTDQTVYSVDLNNPATAAVPLPAYPTPACNNGTDRPWALKVHDDMLYLGVVCSAEGAAGVAADLDAYVYAYDGTAWSTAINNFPLDYPRQLGAPGATNNAAWRPWRDAHTAGEFGTLNLTAATRATPVLSDIEFNDQGDMILGFMDRTSLQFGALNWGTTGTSRIQVASAGDILTTTNNGDGTFTVENITTASANSTLATDEFYGGEIKTPNHREIAQGGLAVLPGSGEVMSTAMDPITFNTGGILWSDNGDGSRNNGFELFFGRQSSNAGAAIPGFMGKGAGLGDIELLCDPAPIQIGNLVWIDTDGDGIQNNNVAEPGIENVTVELYAALDPDGIFDDLVGTTVTDSLGHYYFGGIGNVGMTVGNLEPNTDYEIRVPLADPDLAGNSPTTQDATSALADDDIRDSDGDNGVLNAGASTIAYTTGDPGQNDHTLDFGFVGLPVVSIGSIVWNDLDNSGTQDPGEAGIAGAVITLIDPVTGNPVPSVGTQTTDATGRYFFDNLPEGDYQIQVDMTGTTGFIPSTTQVANADGNAPGDSNIATTPSAGIYRSATVNLAGGAEPTAAAEVSGLLNTANGGVLAGDEADDAADANGNMTVDFGFYAPPLVSIGSVVWSDDDNNGTQNAGEAGIPGAIVTLIDPATGNPVLGVPSQPTDGNGRYFFDTLPEGNYQVQVDMTGIPNFIPTSIQVANADGNAPGDSNIATTPSAGIYRSATVNLADGAEPTGGAEVSLLPNNGDNADDAADANGNMTVDFGFVPTVVIGSRVWIETDGDGDASNGAPTPVVGSIVTATSTTTGLTYTDTTDGAGNYGIDVPINDTYTVTITPPPGHAPTTQLGGGNIPLNDTTGDDQSHDGTGTTVVVETTDNLSVDFGFVIAPPATDIPVSPKWALLMLMLGLLLFSFRSGGLRRS